MPEHPPLNPSFLKTKYQDLGASEEVSKVAKRTEAKTGTKVADKPEDRIQNYLDYIFKESLDPNDPHHREEKLAKFKQSLYDKYVIKPDEIPEAYFALQQRIDRERGRGNKEITPDIKRQHADVLITDQKSSLDTWLNYLSSPDATYPDWLKYWAIRSILGMGEYDKEKKQFTKRRKDTVKPFPDLDHEALAHVLGAVKAKYSSVAEREALRESQERHLAEAELDLTPEEKATRATERTNFEQLLQGESFAKLYAWAIEKVTPASKEKLTITEGKWVKYNQGSDHTPLVTSLQGHGTGWCTAGEETAKTQLQNGDFYVYYSLDPKGQPTVPRAAIRMQQGSIAEVRGIAPNQNLDPFIGKVVQDKLAEFPDGKLYEKKNQDMLTLTAIDNKMKAGQDLTIDELKFLYEINTPIQGFGFEKDPRIQELRSKRDPKVDSPLVFDCTPKQIAHNQQEVNEDTKAYIGPLFPNIFQTLKHLDHIYTTFPEGKIRRTTIEIGGQTKEELQAEMKRQNIQIYGYAQSMLDSQEFTTAKKSEPADLVILKVRDFNLANPTTEDIYKKAEELGLELCPSEVCPQYRLQYTDQPMGEYFCIAIKQITTSDGSPGVFELGHHDYGLYLDDHWAGSTGQWNPYAKFVFRIRK